MQPGDRRAMLGYVIDPTIEVGDMCWQGPLKLVRGKLAGALFTSADNDVYVIPDVPNLREIATFLNEHPETGAALRIVVSDFGETYEPDYDPNDVDASVDLLRQFSAAIGGTGE